MKNLILLNNFFKQIFENHINNDMLELNYVFPTDKVMQYINDLCSIPYKDYIDYLIKEGSFKPIESGDITQNSNINDCHLNLCRVISDAGDPGLDFDSIGRLLQNDGVVRMPGADKKYGENQVKTASQLGLAWELCGTWYLTCIGKVFCDLSEETKLAIMSRCMLRSPFYSRILCDAMVTDIRLEDYMGILSQSTIKRRLPSVRKMLNIVLQANKDQAMLQYRLATVTFSHSNGSAISIPDTTSLLLMHNAADDGQIED